MNLGLAGRTYVVTGGTRGLGRATAEVLVAEGANVVVSSRSQESVDETVAALGANAAGIVADNADAATAGRLVETARERFGGLDGALISVGGPVAGTIMERSEEEWRAAFDSVFLGAVRVATTVAEALGDGGSIAFVLSTSAKMPVPNLGISNGLRPGLAMAAKTLADELGPRGIRVNGLLPGRVDTDRVQELDAASDDPEATKARHIEGIPLRRYGDPAEFGRTAAYLLSPASGYVTGVMLPVDGGQSRGL
ncbi:SDR family NAD(P)-dependent oxidoreductase [Aeromicrobium terrae]|uniref:SDR family oxidoreductase n=1 Tax=Aeromicrobium terrae TaxID=2498846 RepID=A0A5C8NC91_9ACTN|nr:SDR family oxidoreductase [Aeromicrobium terrae]TXL56534.1 SDR family oxidoreductase [Aeromicrobium terrae]